MPELRPLRHAPEGSASQRKLTPREAATVASHARLAKLNWNALTARANASAQHVSSLDRWRRQAAAANPGLSGPQLDRLAEILKRDFYRAAGIRSGAARRLKAGLSARPGMDA